MRTEEAPNAKSGIGLSFDAHGEPVQVELVRDSYLDGSLAVSAYVSDPESADFGEPWCGVTVNLGAPWQDGSTVLLDTNNMNEAMLSEVTRLGSFDGPVARSGYCSYPAFTFDDEVMENMRDMREFLAADHLSLSETRRLLHDALSNVYGERFTDELETGGHGRKCSLDETAKSARAAADALTGDSGHDGPDPVGR